MPRHILNVIQRYYPYLGGSEQVCQVIAERLAAEGHQVSVWTSDAWDLDHFWAAGRRVIETPAETHNGVAIRRFPVRRAPGPPLVHPILRRLMVELGRVPGTAGLLTALAQITPRLPGLAPALAASSEPIDLIHSANITLDFTIIPALRFARARGIPHVLTPYVHLGEPGDESLVRYYSMRHHIELMRRSDRVLVQTGLEEDFLAARGVPRAIMRRVGVGVEPDELAGGDAARFREETGIAAPFVLSISTLARDKGTLDLIEAMRRLWAAGRPEDLVLIGTPMAQFEAAYAALPAETRRRVHVFARAPQERKRDALAAASLFAMPSRTDSFGIVYLEAWLYGLPVIGARAGGVPDVIRDGETGWLVPFAAPAALAGRIGWLLDNPGRAAAMGAAGRERVLRELTWSRVYAKLRAVYAELIDLD
ncbi:MAG TPA: glycosyltransferase family 4 protein [Herpetosiphonaceae bacterium]